MIRNVGRLDRFIRLAIGVLLLAILYTEVISISSDEGMLLGAFAAVMLFTGLTNWCPVYRVLGLSTNQVA
ncbi:DUF2892 domain-containing protein [Lewinella sp. W8]|uniref:YgaP family membrane protein n=1 Tax=Lewinella sp. W8 TaxID=2528208 RepID=UPI0010672731|nr:DUF2892 domain-containing protein [Lewinella sp. W8]MTB52880.1 DUF2892 domain-containing protein [Lewinella sp. W8]